MNKKLLICGLIATGLVLTACVKKEEPKNDEAEKVETTQTQQPAQFENLETAEHNLTDQPQINQDDSSQQVNDHSGSTETTQTQQPVQQPTAAPRAEPKPAQHVETAVRAEPKPAAPKPEAKPAPVETARAETAPVAKANSGTAQTEDDAVAAAIAAATPALKN